MSMESGSKPEKNKVEKEFDTKTIVGEITSSTEVKELLDKDFSDRYEEDEREDNRRIMEGMEPLEPMSDETLKKIQSDEERVVKFAETIRSVKCEVAEPDIANPPEDDVFKGKYTLEYLDGHKEEAEFEFAATLPYENYGLYVHGASYSDPFKEASEDNEMKNVLARLAYEKMVREFRDKVNSSQ